MRDGEPVGRVTSGATATRSSARSPTPTCPLTAAPDARSRWRSSASGSQARSRWSRSSIPTGVASADEDRAPRRRDHEPQLQADGAASRSCCGSAATTRASSGSTARWSTPPRSTPPNSNRAWVVDSLEPEGFLITRFVEASPGGSTWRRRSHCSPAARGAADPGRVRQLRVVEAYGELARPASTTGRTSCRADRGPPRPPPVGGVPQRSAAGELHQRRQPALATDWEYAGMGDPAFDFANFAVNNGLPIGEDDPPSTSWCAMSDFREASGRRPAEALELRSTSRRIAEHFERLSRRRPSPAARRSADPTCRSDSLRGTVPAEGWQPVSSRCRVTPRRREVGDEGDLSVRYRRPGPAA